jgi:ketosteroid isomerase-like protein
MNLIESGDWCIYNHFFKGEGDMSFNTVQAVLEAYQTAVFEKDVDQFLAIYGADVHIYDCWNQWEFTGISHWREMTEEWFDGLNEEGVFLKVEFKDTIIQENEELAFVHCSITFAAHNQVGEKLRQLTNRFTFGLKKIEESWKIVHEHSSLPVNK